MRNVPPCFCGFPGHLDVYTAATKVNAEIIMRDDLGTIEPGKLADLIVVSGDPLKDITLLRDPENVKLVMQGGEIKKQLPA